MPKVLHHAMFDLRFLASRWRCRPASVRCTKICSKLLRPRDPGATHSLKPLLARYLGVTLDKTQQTSDWLAPELSQEQLEYAANDVIYLHALVAELRARLRESSLCEVASGCFEHIPTRVFLEVGDFPDVFAY